MRWWSALGQRAAVHRLDDYLERRLGQSGHGRMTCGADMELGPVVDRVLAVVRTSETGASHADWATVLGAVTGDSHGVATNSAGARLRKPDGRQDRASSRSAEVRRYGMSYVIKAGLVAAVVALLIGGIPIVRDILKDEPRRIVFQGTDSTPTIEAARSPIIPESCDVTLPNGVDPRNVSPPGHWFGKDGLYVGVPTDGISYAKTEPDMIGGWNKHIWVNERVDREVAVSLTFQGEPSTDEQGRVGSFSGSYVAEIYFPEAGCWTITGTAGDVTIAVTVWVVFVDSWIATPEATRD